MIHDFDDQGSSEKEGLLETAEKTATIVANGVESGDFSIINKKLKELPREGTERSQYVFPASNEGFIVAIMVFAVIMIVFFTYIGVVSTGIVCYSEDFKTEGIVGLLISVTVILANGFYIWRGFLTISFYKRYAGYEDIIKYKNLELIEDIAVFSNVDEELVIKDLVKAVKNGFIPEGHFGKNNVIFIVSNETYNKYLDKQALYDRYYRKILEERHRMGERSRKIQQIIDEGQRYVDHIKESNAVIKDKVITQKLTKMEKIVSMIFHEVDVNPQKSSDLDLLLSYYLPTTEKLLNSYIDQVNQKADNSSIKNICAEIENSLDHINDCFEGILDSFYEQKELDILSEISAMEMVMRQEQSNA